MRLKRDYRVPQSSLAHVKAEDRPWAAIEVAWHAYAECPDSQLATFLKRLTPGQRAFVALNGLEAEVNNGGIHQFLWNSTGNLFQEALAGLKLIGAEAHQKLLCKVARLFPDPAVLQSLRRRRKAVDKIRTEQTDKLFDTPFYELEGRKRTQLSTLQLAYLKKHPEEFILPAGQAEERFTAPKPGRRDYRVPRKKIEKVRGEQLHWTLIAKIWDDYWEPLKLGKQEMLDFLPVLSKGQRALIAIDILNKVTLHSGGFSFFLGTQAGADVLALEVLTGFQLLGAKPYEDLFTKVRSTAGDLLQLNAKAAEQHRMIEAAKKSGDEAAIQVARQDWLATYKLQKRREQELEEPLEPLNEEFKVLLQSADHKIERYIEAYVDAHPEEFVR